MTGTNGTPAGDASAVEMALRDELAQGDAVLGSVGPILRHLLTNDDNALFSEEVIARLRGMLHDLARQLLDRLAPAHDDAQWPGSDPGRVAALASMLAQQPALLGHVHVVALEAQLTERLHAQLGLDPVLSPLLQALLAASRADVAAEAMALLAAQARFVQAARRMQLALADLPGDHFHAAVMALRHFVGGGEADQERAAAAEAALRGQYDESRSRPGQLARIVTGMGGGATAALAVNHAGVALFLTALGLASGQERDLAVLSTGEAQVSRLLVALRAAGLKPEAAEQQVLTLHPDARLPAGFDTIGANRAATILAHAPGRGEN